MNGVPLKKIDVGSKVVIIEPKLNGESCACGCELCFMDSMRRHIGTTHTIGSRSSSYDAKHKWFKFDDISCSWCVSWLKRF